MNNSKLKWYLGRMMAMSPLELVHRMNNSLKTEMERRTTPTQRTLPVSQNTWERFLCEKDSRFFFSWDERESIRIQYRDIFSSEIQATIQKADRLLKHEIVIFGHQCDLGKEINWQCNPLTKQDWPPHFWADINTRDGQSRGGVKWVWELNRHHHLVTLGKAHFLTGKEEYAAEACNQIISWINTNHPLYGINWTSPLELAIRLINWIWTLAFIRHSKILKLEQFTPILQSIVDQTNFITRHLSFFSSANNHLIGEAAGLAFTGIFFSELPQAKYWRDTGIKILTQEIEKQIYSDGVCREQAFHYLLFVLDLNIHVWELAKINDITVPSIWYTRLLSSCEFLFHILDEKGDFPAIGDSDDAWVVCLDDKTEVNNARSILASAASIFHHPDFRGASRSWDEKSNWLFGHKGLNRYNSLSTTSSQAKSRAFQDGGYCVMRSNKCVLVFDCGPVGYLSTAAHGHADALSLTVSYDSIPLLIDPNTYAYQEGTLWRDFFKSTAAHNTIVINQANQSENKGTFLWGRKANSRLVSWNSTEDYDIAIAEHDGYERDMVIHKRAVIFLKPAWVIVVDKVVGDTNGEIEQLWHFAAESQITSLCNSSHFEIITSGQKSEVYLLLPQSSLVEIVKGKTHPDIQGWQSLHYGKKAPAPVIRCYIENAQLPVELITAIRLNTCIASPYNNEKGDINKWIKNTIKLLLSKF